MLQVEEFKSWINDKKLWNKGIQEKLLIPADRAMDV